VRKHLVWVLGLGAAVAVGAAGLATAREQPVVVRAGNLILKVNGGLTPKALPRDRLAPVFFHGNGSLSTVDGSHPPALKEVIFDADKNVRIDVRGLPVCTRGKLFAFDSRSAKRACGSAILGKGSATVRVAFPDQTPFNATGPLILFNGGSKGGVITLFLHTYVAVPTPTAVVATAELRRAIGERLANHFIFSVPLIAGGSGSVIHAGIVGGRLYDYRGERKSFVSAKCADGRFLGRGTFKFRDETQITGSVIRRCRAIG
jgi:hypothetical protein